MFVLACCLLSPCLTSCCHWMRSSPAYALDYSSQILPLVSGATALHAYMSESFLAIIDFLIRHGYLTVEDEPQYQALVTRLHGRFQYEQW